ncbi:MAG TPA: kelch repeat-containing protein [Bacteroidales bacterium]|nr:kelch repeat-containing protein [Bacteroidales bacterium]
MKNIFTLITFCVAIYATSQLNAQNEWTQLTPTGDIPSEREGMAMVTIGNAIYLFGGYNNSESNMNDLHRFNPSSGSWEELTPDNAEPEARSGHKAVAYDGKMYIFFGSGAEGFLDDIWQYNPTTNQWTEIVPFSDIYPGARAYNSIVLIGNMAWFYGGISDGGEVLTDLWAFNFGNSQWESYPAYSGDGRHGHIAARKDSEMYIIGGYEGFSAVNTIICYHTGSGTWSTLSKKGSFPEPFAYAGHSQIDNQVFIFGGATNSDVTGNAYLWDLNEMNFAPLAVGPVRSDPGVTHVPGPSQDKDAQYQAFMLFGGSNMGLIEDETWYYYSDIEIQSNISTCLGNPHIQVSQSGHQIFISSGTDILSGAEYQINDLQGRIFVKATITGQSTCVDLPYACNGLFILTIKKNKIPVFITKLAVY